ncbi:hypothetical protein LY28_01314 [Ruminiclostridium sufflavum DSM 19573]|uniref:Excisionase family DNA binding protein n=1 Tax=Ruminiclostridium sufflavum DSM 19573 TaxID=1121337 RepID=A0A318XQF8_9FIRM|nr:hypothetical protein [Ruminiclostridium sufflavum]PYG88465.1 hypothetical protein LY28_01314 [Ruminiclostridium sufflavum DSM 19573]
MTNSAEIDTERSDNTLSMTHLAEKWRCSNGDVRKFIKQGMPYVVLKNGRYQFNLKKCEDWYRRGFFESLPEQRQREILSKQRMLIPSFKKGKKIK